MSDTAVAPATPADPSAPCPRSRARGWTVTVLLVVFMMINFADKSVLGLAADPIRRDLGLSATGFGAANSAFFLLFSLSGAAVGLLSDRIRPTWLLLGMALLWSVAQAPVALGGGVAWLVTSRVTLGAGEGPAFPVAQHTALSWFDDRRRNLPGALITVGTTLGVVVAAPALTWLIQHHGWRPAFGAVGIAGLLWAGLWAWRGREAPGSGQEAGTPSTPATPASADPPAPVGPSYRSIMRTRTWIGATTAYFTTYWCVALLLVWLPAYLHDSLGYSTTAAAGIVALLWAVAGAAMLGQAGLTGWLLRRGVDSRWARARVGGITLTACALALLVVPLAGSGTLVVLLLAVGFGLSGVMTTIAVTSVAELVPGQRRGGALGLMNAVVTTAGLLAPTLTGSLVDAQGSAGYQHAVQLAGLLLLLGGTAALTLVDPQRDARLLSA